MDERSLIQEYYILAVNENGYMPMMYRDESNAGLVAAGMTELMQNGVITIEKVNGLMTIEQKKIRVVKELPEELSYLAALYDYLKEKTRSVGSLMGSYAVMGSGIQKLTERLSIFQKRTIKKKQCR